MSRSDGIPVFVAPFPVDRSFTAKVEIDGGSPLKPSLRSISCLDEVHQSSLLHAVRNVLSTSLAETTLAQIVDGVPTADVERYKYQKSSISLGNFGSSWPFHMPTLLTR
jgi:hypothetical protein